MIHSADSRSRPVLIIIFKCFVRKTKQTSRENNDCYWLEWVWPRGSLMTNMFCILCIYFAQQSQSHDGVINSLKMKIATKCDYIDVCGHISKRYCIFRPKITYWQYWSKNRYDAGGISSILYVQGVFWAAGWIFTL